MPGVPLQGRENPGGEEGRGENRREQKNDQQKKRERMPISEQEEKMERNLHGR